MGKYVEHDVVMLGNSQGMPVVMGGFAFFFESDAQFDRFRDDARNGLQVTRSMMTQASKVKLSLTRLRVILAYLREKNVIPFLVHEEDGKTRLIPCQVKGLQNPSIAEG